MSGPHGLPQPAAPGATHFAYPFEFGLDGKVRTVKQGTREEIIGVCVRNVLLYPLGSRPLVPDFGVEDQAFEQGAPDIDEIRAAIAANEPRADTDVDLDDEELAEIAAGVARVRVQANVTGGQ